MDFNKRILCWRVVKTWQYVFKHDAKLGYALAHNGVTLERKVG